MRISGVAQGLSAVDERFEVRAILVRAEWLLEQRRTFLEGKACVARYSYCSKAGRGR
jgi:hypothetical protein